MLSFKINIEAGVLTCYEGEQEAGFIKFRIIDEEVVAVLSTKVNEAFRGRGIAEQLTVEILAWAEQNHRKIRPICTYMAAYLERHTEYQHLREDITQVNII